jgi:hypothetical protein
MRLNEAMTMHRRAATVAAVALVGVLAGGACGGESLGMNPGPDGSADAANPGPDGSAEHDTGGPETSTRQDARADEDAGTMSSNDAAMPDASAPDAHGVVPMNHRADDSQCRATRPEGSCALAGSPSGGYECFSDGDCNDGGANGRCLVNGGGPAGCFCSYDRCQSDSDCGANQACACHGSSYTYGGNECIAASCRVDADCGANRFCSPSQGPHNCDSLAGYYCHTPNDACTNDSDCPGGQKACMWSTGDGRWECTAIDPSTCPV